jgi:hypothetical protein
MPHHSIAHSVPSAASIAALVASTYDLAQITECRLLQRGFNDSYADDVDAMHECFANSEAMRFWNQPVYTKRIETERAVRNFIDCTPPYYRFWAVADAETDRCLGLVNSTTAISAVSG